MRLSDLEEGRVSWHDAAVVCQFAPPGTPLAAVIEPVNAWTLDQHIAALHYDFVRLVAWAQGGRKGEEPKPLPRPWNTKNTKTESIVADVLDLDEAEAWYAELRRNWETYPVADVAESGGDDDGVGARVSEHRSVDEGRTG